MVKQDTCGHFAHCSYLIYVLSVDEVWLPIRIGYFVIHSINTQSLPADSALKLLQAGKFNKSNIMIGVTKDDGSVFLGNSTGNIFTLSSSPSIIINN